MVPMSWALFHRPLQVVDMDPEIEEFDDDFEIPDDLDRPTRGYWMFTRDLSNTNGDLT
jgi:hypothetical protein